MSNVKVKKVQEHYEIWVNGEFYCSCDTLREVLDEVHVLEEEIWEQ